MIDTLAKRGEPAVESLREILDREPVLARRNAVWTLTRIGTAAALATARFALDDADPSVRLVASTCAATHRDAEAVDQLVGLLSGPESAVRREAATSLGRIGSVDAVPALLKAFEEAGDRMLEHAIIYALIEVNDPETTRAGLENPSARVRRAALVALDQMEDSKLTHEMVSPLLKTDDVLLLEAVVDVVGGHPEWVEIAAGLITSWLLEPELTAARQLLLRDAVYALRRQPACQALMAELLSRPDTSAESRILLLDVMVDSGFRDFPLIWQQQVLSNLASSNIRVAGKSLIAMASTNARQFDDGLLKYVQNTTRPVSLRVRAASILSRDGAALLETTFELLRSQCGQDAAFETRLEAARAIDNLKLSSEKLESVIGLVAHAGPLELPLLLKPLAGVVIHANARIVHFLDDLCTGLPRACRTAVLLDDQQHVIVTGDRTQLLESFDPQLAIAALGMPEREDLWDAGRGGLTKAVGQQFPARCF